MRLLKERAPFKPLLKQRPAPAPIHRFMGQTKIVPLIERPRRIQSGEAREITGAATRFEQKIHRQLHEVLADTSPAPFLREDEPAQARRALRFGRADNRQRADETIVAVRREQARDRGIISFDKSAELRRNLRFENLAELPMLRVINRVQPNDLADEAWHPAVAIDHGCGHSTPPLWRADRAA